MDTAYIEVQYVLRSINIQNSMLSAVFFAVVKFFAVVSWKISINQLYVYVKEMLLNFSDW